jgi:Ser/Thr protein kinase RdoA (MazF antagonist)
MSFLKVKPYDELTRLGQLRRIRQLARAALDAYGLRGARLTFLRYFANITYRVDVPGPVPRGDSSGPYLPNRYLLRVLLSNHWEYAKGEMTWLRALSHEAALPVPEPVPTLAGELLTRITTPGVPEGRIVSLMRWVDGRKRTTELRPRHLRALGRLIARLHAFAAGWQPPEGFERYVWDWEGLLGGRGFGYTVEELVASMPEHLQEPFQLVSSEARAVMEDLGKGPDAYGLIHGDTYLENLLFKAGQVFPIDFEDCGFGYWLWDIAVALSQQPWTESWYRRRDAFLEGYAQVFPLPEPQLGHLNLFMAADYATGVLWASSFIQDDPARRAEHEAWRDENGAMLLRYLEQH